MNLQKVFLFGAIAALTAFSPPVTHAHGDEEESGELEGYEITVTPEEAIQGDELPIEARIEKTGAPLAGSTVTLTVDRHEQGVSDRLSTTEREPGSYVTKYNFRNAGEYEIHVEFTDAGETKRVTSFVYVLAKSFWAPGRKAGVGIGAAALLALIVGFLRKKPKAAIMGAIAVLIAGGIAYSLTITFRSGAISKGVVTCITPNECFLTAHVHAYVPIEICGNEFRLPIETGSLSGPHTHEEKNIIHWHDRLPYDNVAKKLRVTDPLTLGAFFDAIEIPFELERFGDRENGNACEDGKPGFLKMFVNGSDHGVQRDYVWSDKDVIFVVFDSRLPSEVETWLKANPIAFPALGRG